MKPALITFAIIVLYLTWYEAEASEYEDCAAFASFVETALEADPERRERQWNAWRKLVTNPHQLRIVNSAQLFVNQGGTADQAWRSCPGV